MPVRCITRAPAKADPRAAHAAAVAIVVHVPMHIHLDAGRLGVLCTLYGIEDAAAELAANAPDALLP